MMTILIGYNKGPINVVLEYLEKYLGFIENIHLWVWVLSLNILGATIGSLICYVLVEKHGRRKFQIDGIFVLIGAMLCATTMTSQWCSKRFWNLLNKKAHDMTIDLSTHATNNLGCWTCHYFISMLGFYSTKPYLLAWNTFQPFFPHQDLEISHAKFLQASHHISRKSG